MQRTDLITTALATAIFAGAIMLTAHGGNSSWPTFANASQIAADSSQARQDNCGVSSPDVGRPAGRNRTAWCAGVALSDRR